MSFQLKQFEQVLDVPRIANIHYFEFLPNFDTGADRHPHRELIYVDYGRVEIESDNYRGVLLPKQLIIHKENEMHALRCPDDTPVNVAVIGFECHCPELDVFSQMPISLPQQMQPLLSDIMLKSRSMFLPPYDLPGIRDMKRRSDQPFGTEQQLKIMIELLLIQLIQNSGVTDHEEAIITKTNNVGEYLDQNFRENLKLDDLCFLFNTNKTTLCSRFRQTYGCTITSYVNRLKIEEAKRLLRQEKHSVSQISQQLSFSSVHYFSRMFKQYTGLSPKKYVDTIKSKLNI
ncbi:MAG: helix-turn-helix transcriptional regulator [Clostridia bacterium]|nr:helix-turn-helix transcriptional regulator [Clostridia bacterium]